jgi:hypothetical protein
MCIPIFLVPGFDWISRFGVGIVVTASVAQAVLDFHSYRAVDSRYELTRLGSSSLESSTLTVTSQGGYLQVVEEAILTGNLEVRPNDITQDFLLQGTLPLPPLAAVHALTVYHGDTAFSANFKKMVYSVNEVFFDSTVLQTTLNSRVAFFQQLTDDVYEMTLAKLSLGEPVRVRIAYVLPFPGAPGTSVQVPVLFHPSGLAPRNVQITFYEAESGRSLPPVQWLSPQGRVSLNHQATHTLAYQSAYVLRRDEAPQTQVTLQSTHFETGRFKGHYLLFKSGLSDSLMTLLSRPLETVFFWRWNAPYDFITRVDGLKALSSNGHMAVLQARAIKQAMQELGKRGHKVGLYHSRTDKPDVFLTPKATTDNALYAYLDGFDEIGIFEAFKNHQDTTLPWAPSAWQDSSAYAKSQAHFLATVGQIKQALTQQSGVLTHIEMLGIGFGEPGTHALTDSSRLEEILGETTMAQVLASWPGVNLNRILRTQTNQNLRPVQITGWGAGLPPLLFPVFQPTTVEYRVFSNGHSHSLVMPFQQSAERQAMIKANSTFADSVHLLGTDALGGKTRILTLSPRQIRRSQDSGLARLWAADPNRVAESLESDLGMRYGILSKASFFAASVGEGRFEASWESETIPVLPKRFISRPQSRFWVAGGHLRITHASHWTQPMLELYDMRGRLLLRINLAEYWDGQAFVVPLERLKALSAGSIASKGGLRVTAVLRFAGRNQTFTFNLAGQR